MRIIEIQQEIPGGSFVLKENGRDITKDSYEDVIDYLDGVFDDVGGETKNNARKRANVAEDRLERIANILDY